jgi:hypothetical protein
VAISFNTWKVISSSSQIQLKSWDGQMRLPSAKHLGANKGKISLPYWSAPLESHLYRIGVSLLDPCGLGKVAQALRQILLKSAQNEPRLPHCDERCNSEGLSILFERGITLGGSVPAATEDIKSPRYENTQSHSHEGRDMTEGARGKRAARRRGTKFYTYVKHALSNSERSVGPDSTHGSLTVVQQFKTKKRLM